MSASRARAGLVCAAACVAAVAMAGCRVRASEPFRLVKLAEDRAGSGDGAISPDGAAFVISSHRSGNWDLWMYGRDDQRWRQLTGDPADDIEAQWSPDGTRLAFTSTRGGTKDIWTLSLANRTLRQLTNSPDEEEYPAWSPDGRSIVYTGGPWKYRDYFLVASDGGTPRRITRKSGHAGACSFVPDGESVVCHGYDRGVGAVDIIAIASGARTPVTTGPAWDYKPTIAPGRDWLAFSRSDEGHSAVWLQKPDGGQSRPLVLTDGDDRWPTWTASGDSLFFHRVVDRGVGIGRYDRRTQHVQVIVGRDEQPDGAAFDPSGRQIVYAARTGDGSVLRVRNLAGVTPRSIATNWREAAFPRWSPDGSLIAFLGRNDGRWRICTVPAAGGAVRVLTDGVDLRGVYGPIDWSPDSTHVVFHASTAPFESDIFTVDVRTHALTPVTRDQWYDEAPSWTPDGRALLFMSTRGGNWTWGLFRRETSGIITAIAGPDDVEKNYPRMGSDGFVVWSGFDAQGHERLIERSRSGTARELPTGADDARWPSYSRDGAAILFTQRERRVEYWVAEHLNGPGSPLLTETHVASQLLGLSGPADGLRVGGETPSISPRQLHHR